MEAPLSCLLVSNMLSADFTIVICSEKKKSKQEGAVNFAACPWNVTTNGTVSDHQVAAEGKIRGEGRA